MKKKIKIVSRASQLARVQAYMVGAQISNIFPTVGVEYSSKNSEGDINPNHSISSGQVTGLFTHNISNAISKGEFDIAVHSWKDVPIEPSENSTIFGTIKRGDMRDMLFIKKDSLKNLDKDNISIFTSSPRRKYLSQILLKNLIPFKGANLSFHDIRGNVETRLKKLNDSNMDGLIIAKTAIDRLLSKQYNEDDAKSSERIRNYINNFRWMIFPLSCFPTAPGQAAIGIEVNNSNDEAINIVNQINDAKVFQMVQHEKSVLNVYGGGCHQKIGVSNWVVDDLELESIQGLTDEGNPLSSYKIKGRKEKLFSNVTRSSIFPSSDNEKNLFSREKVDNSQKIKETKNSIVYISRKNVLDSKPVIDDTNFIWTSGMKAWRNAAKKGYWINGTSDSFGENIDFDIHLLANNIKKKVKLTHLENKSTDMEIIPTYKLIYSNEDLELSDKTHFYWMSSFAFDSITEKYPEIKDKIHGCGPGKTYNHIIKNIKDRSKVSKYLSFKDWENNFES